MDEFLYLLKVTKDIEKDLAKRLILSKPPTHARVATLAPLSNYGFVGAVEGALLGVNSEGIVVGVEGREEIPRLFVPWQNVSYIADGTTLAKESAKLAQAAVSAEAAAMAPPK